MAPRIFRSPTKPAPLKSPHPTDIFLSQIIFVARDVATGEDLARSETLYMRNNSLYFINVIGDATRPEVFPFRFVIFPPDFEPSNEHTSYTYLAPVAGPGPLDEDESTAFIPLTASQRTGTLAHCHGVSHRIYIPADLARPPPCPRLDPHRHPRRLRSNDGHCLISRAVHTANSQARIVAVGGTQGCDR
jgi:hypothetical protein